MKSTDPTKTLSLRRKFSRELTKRFRVIRREIIISVDHNDCFGLRAGKGFTSTPGALPLAGNRRRRGEPAPTVASNRLAAADNIISDDRLAARKIPKGDLRLRSNEPIPARSFSFVKDEEKISFFMAWLKDMEEKEILEVILQPGIAGARKNPWTNLYVQSAYQSGLKKAWAEARKAGADIPAFTATKQGLSAVMNAPIHAEKLALAYTRVFSDLEGITEVMDRQIARILTRGISEGRSPYDIARGLANRVDKIGISRAQLLARTEVVNIHNESKLNSFAAIGEAIDQDVLVKWFTARDERVRSTHAARHNVIYTEEQARAMIGEPNCRCTLLPVVDQPDATVSLPEWEKKFSHKKPGVIQSIINMVSKRPMTRAQVIAQLKKDFPDRKETALTKTVSVQLGSKKPGALRKQYDLKLEGDKFVIGKPIGKPVKKPKVPVAKRKPVKKPKPKPTPPAGVIEDLTSDKVKIDNPNVRALFDGFDDIPEMRYKKAFRKGTDNNKTQALLVSTHKNRFGPITYPAGRLDKHSGLAIRVFENGDIYIDEISSAKKGLGSKLVKNLIDNSPRDVKILISADYSDGWWEKIQERYPRNIRFQRPPGFGVIPRGAKKVKRKPKPKKPVPVPKPPKPEKPTPPKTPPGKRPKGVIQNIVHILEGGKFTFDEILDELEKRFPERRRAAMSKTVATQLGKKKPGQLQKVKKLNITIDDDGRYVYIPRRRKVRPIPPEPKYPKPVPKPVPKPKPPKEEYYGRASSKRYAPWKNVEHHTEAEREMKKRFKKMEFDFYGMDIEAINESCTAFIRMHNLFPQVRTLKYFGTYRTRRTRWHSWQGEANVWAHVNRNRGSMGMNSYHFGNVEEFRDKIKYTVNQHYHPKGVEGLTSVINHEFGHALHNELASFGFEDLLETGRKGSNRVSIPFDTGGIFPKNSTLLFRFFKYHCDKGKVNKGPRFSPHYLSEYAKKNYLEAFAESFSQMVQAKREDWHELTKKMEKLINVLLPENKTRGVAGYDPKKSWIEASVKEKKSIFPIVKMLDDLEILHFREIHELFGDEDGLLGAYLKYKGEN